MLSCNFSFFELCLGSNSLLKAYEAPPHRFPYFAALRLAKSGRTFCAGVLISQNYVLTAASCLRDQNGMTKDESDFGVSTRPDQTHYL